MMGQFMKDNGKMINRKVLEKKYSLTNQLMKGNL